MDNGWLTLLAGGLLTLAGNFLANYFTLRRDREQWERQQQAEREKLEREKEERAREHLREVYTNCVRSLTQYERVRAGDEDTTEYDALTPEERKRYHEERTRYYAEAQPWLLLLSANLNNVGSNDLGRFNEELDAFMISTYYTGELRELVMKFARNDPRLKNNITGIAELAPAPKPKELPNT